MKTLVSARKKRKRVIRVRELTLDQITTLIAVTLEKERFTGSHYADCVMLDCLRRRAATVSIDEDTGTPVFVFNDNEGAYHFLRSVAAA